MTPTNDNTTNITHPKPRGPAPQVNRRPCPRKVIQRKSKQKPGNKRRRELRLRACLHVDNRGHELTAHHPVRLLHRAASSVAGVDCAQRHTMGGGVWLLVTAAELHSGDQKQVL